MAVIFIVLGLIVLGLLFFVSIYNKLVRLRNNRENAFEFLGGIINIEKCTSGCGF